MMPARMLKTVIVATNMHNCLTKVREHHTESRIKGCFLGQPHIQNETVYSDRANIKWHTWRCSGSADGLGQDGSGVQNIVSSDSSNVSLYHCWSATCFSYVKNTIRLHLDEITTSIDDEGWVWVVKTRWSMVGTRHKHDVKKKNLYQKHNHLMRNIYEGVFERL